MEEVQRQIAPLAATVTRMDKTLRSLYRNGTDPGGPPGFLETARAEDRKTIGELMELKHKEIERLEKVEESIKDAELVRKTQAEVVATQVQNSEKRFKKLLVSATLVLAILQIVNILWDHRGILKSVLDAPLNPGVSSTQQSGMPDDRFEPIPQK